MKKEKIIAYSVDDKYVNYLCVSIFSLLSFCSNDSNYRIVILFDVLDSASKRKIQETVGDKQNIQIEFISVASFFGNNLYVGAYGENYLSVVTYYRLALVEIFPDTELVLYLDCDVVINHCIDNLYELPMEDYMLAGVSDYADNWKCRDETAELAEYRCGVLRLEDPCGYINAGVILLNIKNIKKEYTFKSLLELAESNHWRKHDQDVINMIANGRILFLRYEWNLIECMNPGAWSYFSEEEKSMYLHAKENPYIIHYAARKPWKEANVQFESFFWKYAFQLRCAEEIKSEFMEGYIQNIKRSENLVIDGILTGKTKIRFFFRCVKAYMKRWMAYIWKSK